MLLEGHHNPHIIAEVLQRVVGCELLCHPESQVGFALDALPSLRLKRLLPEPPPFLFHERLQLFDFLWIQGLHFPVLRPPESLALGHGNQGPKLVWLTRSSITTLSSLIPKHTIGGALCGYEVQGLANTVGGWYRRLPCKITALGWAPWCGVV